MVSLKRVRGRSLFLFVVCAFFVTVSGCAKESTAFILKGSTISAGEATIIIDDKAIVSSIMDGAGNEILSEEERQPLISLIVANTQDSAAETASRSYPLGWSFSKSDDAYRFRFSDDIFATVSRINSEGYVKLELTAIENPQNKDVRAIIWGPIASSIIDNVADVLGVVYNQDFAFGVQALNVKTIGGWPNEYNFLGFRDQVLDGTGEWQRASRFEYEGSAAQITDKGTLLQFYTRDYTKSRVIDAFTAPEVDDRWIVDALTDDKTGELWPEARLEGSAIAIFGVSRDVNQPGTRLAAIKESILSRVQDIEIGEGLPHPTFDGEWGKRSAGTKKPYLILSDLGTKTLQTSIDYAKKAGIDYVYHANPWGVFETNGSYEVQAAYDGNDKDSKGSDAELAEQIALAKAQGLDFGTHTLANFLLTKDSYVSPVPHSDLASRTRSPLMGAVDAFEQELRIASDPGFDIPTFSSSQRFIRIDEELISYERAVTDDEGMRLIGVQRGVFGTRAAPHKTAAQVHRLMYIGGHYQVFMAGYKMFPEITSRAAEAINNTGLKLWSFDGLDGATRTGYDHLAANDFVERVYRQLDDPDGFVFDAAYFNHYLWHAISRLNWGEVHGKPAYEAHRALRWGYQAFYARNMLPPMFGWFRIEPETPLEELEWAYSKAASFDGGFSLTTATHILASKKDTDEILKAVRIWEEAKTAGAFTDEQKMMMRDPDSFWRLEEVIQGSTWRLWRIDMETSEKIGSAQDVVRPSANGHQQYNIAGDASVTVSSAKDNTFVGARIIDGQTGVYGGVQQNYTGPQDGYAQVASNQFPGLSGSGEWASSSETKPWVELRWDSLRAVKKLMIFDRATLKSNARGGVIHLSDGREIPFDGLSEGSDPLTVTIGGSPVQSIKLVLDGEGNDVGLSEVVVIATR